MPLLWLVCISDAGIDVLPYSFTLSQPPIQSVTLPSNILASSGTIARSDAGTSDVLGMITAEVEINDLKPEMRWVATAIIGYLPFQKLVSSLVPILPLRIVSQPILSMMSDSQITLSEN